MSVIIISGIPGAGKTLMSTYLMRKKFNKENNFFKRKFKKDHLFNNVFSNYPILLNKKLNIYSNKITKEDFYTYQKWLMDSDIVFDEFQAIFGDSMSFKSFPDIVAKQFQFHRHFGINNIYLLSQHPTRILKIPRDIACEYWKIKKFIHFLGIGLFTYTIYYNYDDYGKSTKKIKDRPIEFDYSNKFRFFFCKKVFNSYNTKYLSVLVDNKEFIKAIPYTDKRLSLTDITNNFNIIDYDVLSDKE